MMLLAILYLICIFVLIISGILSLLGFVISPEWYSSNYKNFAVMVERAYPWAFMCLLLFVLPTLVVGTLLALSVL